MCTGHLCCEMVTGAFINTLFLIIVNVIAKITFGLKLLLEKKTTLDFENYFYKKSNLEVDGD